jgi:hypothetical protein
MNVGRFLLRLIKPLMNQRGEVGAPEPITVQLDENGFIPGTNYKSMDEFVKGHGELKGKFDAQGNELGQVRGQAQTLAETLKETLSKKEPEAKQTDGVDYDAEIANVNAQIEKLDPMGDNYQGSLAKLMSKSNQLTAEKVKNTVLGEAGKLFQKELQDRDIKTSQKEFLKANPTFNTPEMQKRISDYIANDPTGMHDKMSAFFALEKEDIAAQAKTLSDQNAEMMKALELQKGKDSTGKVIVKGQSLGQVTKQPILTGKDRDAAMAEALAKVNGG